MKVCSSDSYHPHCSAVYMTLLLSCTFCSQFSPQLRACVCVCVRIWEFVKQLCGVLLPAGLNHNYCLLLFCPCSCTFSGHWFVASQTIPAEPSRAYGVKPAKHAAKANANFPESPLRMSRAWQNGHDSMDLVSHCLATQEFIAMWLLQLQLKKTYS